MASFNACTEISNAYNVSGSRFPLGISAGNAQIPGKLNPGVPLGMTHGYSVNTPIQSSLLVNLTANTPLNSYLQVNNFPRTLGRYVSDNGGGFQVDYPRAISFSCNLACTVTFNVTDRYGNKAVNVIPGVLDTGVYGGQTNIGVNVINSIYVSIPNPGSATYIFILSTSNYMEMPFTDMGNQIFYEWMGVATGGAPNSNPQVSFRAPGTTAPLTYQFDMAYLPATWAPPGTTTKITTTTGRPRPLMKPQAAGSDVNFQSTPYSFMCQQAVFPTYNPQLSWLMTPAQAESGETTMGLKPDATGWVGWKG